MNWCRSWGGTTLRFLDWGLSNEVFIITRHSTIFSLDLLEINSDCFQWSEQFKAVKTSCIVGVKCFHAYCMENTMKKVFVCLFFSFLLFLQENQHKIYPSLCCQANPRCFPAVCLMFWFPKVFWPALCSWCELWKFLVKQEKWAAFFRISRNPFYVKHLQQQTISLIGGGWLWGIFNLIKKPLEHLVSGGIFFWQVYVILLAELPEIRFYSEAERSYSLAEDEISCGWCLPPLKFSTVLGWVA